MTAALKKQIEYKSTIEELTVILVVKDSVALPSYLKIIAQHKESRTYQVRLSKKALLDLLNANQILFADVYISPKEELTTGTLDLATNKANFAHHQFSFITGDSILVSVKENSFDTTDIDFLHRVKKTVAPSQLVTAHAAIMATTISGAGNSSPQAKGVAYESTLTSANFSSLLPEPDSVYKTNNITVQNHSYGTTVQNYYGAEAMAFDRSAFNNSTLLFVFSAGNSGTVTTDTYTQDFGNLTGNFKMSKNSITIGATDSFYNVAALSSKGPAHDGRIKPELVAFGDDGSSGAAAMVSGAAALLQQAYKRTHHDSLPTSDLIKAVLINSADDIKAAGPDFSSGYGSLNVYAAVKTMIENRTVKDVLNIGTTKEFSITVPPNAAGIKLTLCWTDLPAQPNAAKALIHNLDGNLKSPSGITWQPWILSTVKNRDSLLLPARRGKDSLNNTEQIWIENPEPGIYTFIVNSTNLTAAQPFAFAYEVYQKDAFEWTFPTASDPLPSAENSVLRWQTGKTGSGTLQYSTDKINWKNIAAVPDIKTGYFNWTTPDTSTIAFLRMQFANSGTAVSDTFVISKRLQIETGFDCVDSFLVYWNNTPALRYQLYNLPHNYLQPLVRVSDTFAVLNNAQFTKPYISVAPVIGGKIGLRSFTLNYKGSGAGCYFRSFYLQTQTSSSALFTAALGTIFNLRTIEFQKLINGSYTTLKTFSFPLITDFNFTDSALTKGINQYRLQLTLNTSAIIYSDVITIYHFTNSDVILYPNPVRQGEPLHIVTSKAGRTNITIFNAAGTKLKEVFLSNQLQQLPEFTLLKGTYFITVTTDEGKNTTQKLIVY